MGAGPGIGVARRGWADGGQPRPGGPRTRAVRWLVVAAPAATILGFSWAVRGPGDPVYSGFELGMLVYSRVIPKPLKLRPNDF